jgi:hypothetical protein
LGRSDIDDETGKCREVDPRLGHERTQSGLDRMFRIADSLGERLRLERMKVPTVPQFSIYTRRSGGKRKKALRIKRSAELLIRLR